MNTTPETEVMKEKQKIPRIEEWETSFADLGAEAKFISFWDEATACVLNINPTVFVDIRPVKADESNNKEFMKKLLDNLLGEILDRFSENGWTDEATLMFDFDQYNENSQTLSLLIWRRWFEFGEAEEGWMILPSANKLPL